MQLIVHEDSKGIPKMNTRLRRRAAFLASASALAVAAIAPAAFAQQAQPVATNNADAPTTVNQVIVIGSTSKRTLLDASVAVTAVNQAALDQKAPRGTDDILTLVPGIFVEGTAGPVSNNYSVRGLPGGGQAFVRLVEDGMPIIFGGLNDDEVFQYDLSIDRVEALEGGTSGILTENGAGASINFISRPLNFDQAGGIARVTGASYGEERGDLWYSAPIKGTPLGDNVAFALSGFIDSTHGVRSSPFTYQSYHFKAQLEKKFDGGGYVRATYKRWDEHDPYYADQPYAYRNGKISGVPGLDTQFGNIIGSGFGSITVPDSCAAHECTRTFSELNGIHASGNEYRIDAEKPINNAVSVFAKVRYTQTDWDFNGVFAGSGSGNGGLTSAANYLTYTPDAAGDCANTIDHPVETSTWLGAPAGSPSPIGCLLVGGQKAFGTTQFGIKNLKTGQVIAGSNAAALNALNGNGLLQQTWLNQQLIKLRDWGSDFGVKWNTQGDHWTNSLTVGGMVYSESQSNDQSGVSVVLNDVKNNSNIYDVVALNSSGQVVGDLTNNGLTRYGDWGAGISHYQLDSQSVYLNNEFTWANRLHVDFGLRYEHERQSGANGNSSPAPVPTGTDGIVTVNPNAFNGTYNYYSGSENPLNWTVGVNYTVTPQLSVYARYADAYQTQGASKNATQLRLYEAGVTYAGHGFLGTVRPFHTAFINQHWDGGVDPANPNLNQAFFANSETDGVDLDVTYRPTWQSLHAFSIHGQLTYQESTFNNARTGTSNAGGVNLAQQVATFYDGKVPGRTPSQMYTITPAYDLPNHLGQVYLRYLYTGRIFADNGDGLALPGYGVLGLGGNFNLTPRLNLNVSVDNATDALGLTEGNPRQGFTQSVVNGNFYGRGIIGTNALAQLTYKF
jgi:outer membrane receptor protein involved in Fe transport